MKRAHVVLRISQSSASFIPVKGSLFSLAPRISTARLTSSAESPRSGFVRSSTSRCGSRSPLSSRMKQRPSSVLAIRKSYETLGPIVFQRKPFWQSWRSMDGTEAFAVFLREIFAESPGVPMTLGSEKLRTVLMRVMRNGSTSPRPHLVLWLGFAGRRELSEDETSVLAESLSTPASPSAPRASPSTNFTTNRPRTCGGCSAANHAAGKLGETGRSRRR